MRWLFMTLTECGIEMYSIQYFLCVIGAFINLHVSFNDKRWTGLYAGPSVHPPDYDLCIRELDLLNLTLYWKNLLLVQKHFQIGTYWHAIWYRQCWELTFWNGQEVSFASLSCQQKNIICIFCICLMEPCLLNTKGCVLNFKAVWKLFSNHCISVS